MKCHKICKNNYAILFLHEICEWGGRLQRNVHSTILFKIFIRSSHSSLLRGEYFRLNYVGINYIFTHLVRSVVIKTSTKYFILMPYELLSTLEMMHKIKKCQIKFDIVPCQFRPKKKLFWEISQLRLQTDIGLDLFWILRYLSYNIWVAT